MPRVLIIDDSAMVVAVASQGLAAAGLTVEAASDLQSLDAKLATGPFDLILVDVNMPEMYGDDVVEFLRVQKGVTARLYLYSDIAEAELAARVKASGADGAFSKGAGVEALVSDVQTVLQAGASSRPAVSSRRILVVDDSAAVVKLLEAELVAKGHEVLTATSADAATKIILKKKTRPDVVMLDVHMPGINGEEFCRFVKTNSLFAGIQVILCSGEEEAELARIAAAAGADGYVRKDTLIAQDLLAMLK